ncbi:MAG: glycosyltransferase, partial [Bacteroidota bacterium]
MIPAYKEDAVILHTAKMSTGLDYPEDKWDLVVIGDSLKRETFDELDSMPLTLVEVVFEKSTKAKALNKAMATVGDGYDIIFILDADNIAQKDILYRINNAYQNGFKAIQGHRVAKNLNSAFAILDAMSEEINNRIFSSGHRAVGLSSRLVGSGMAFDYALFKEIMGSIDAIGGFDKELELKLLSRRIKMAYLPSAKVYDEKVSQGDHFTRQRRRWISAQFHYAKRFFGRALKDLLTKGNVDFFDKAFQMILPPRLILPGVLFLGFAVSLLVSPPIWQFLWGGAFLANALAFALGIPGHLYQPKYLKAFLTLPYAFGKMALSLFKLKGSNKTFIHTPHSTTEMT